MHVIATALDIGYLLIDHVRSAAVPDSDRGTTRAYTGTGDLVDRQSVHVRLRDKPGAGPMVWRWLAETCITAYSLQVATLCSLTDQKSHRTYSGAVLYLLKVFSLTCLRVLVYTLPDNLFAVKSAHITSSLLGTRSSSIMSV